MKDLAKFEAEYDTSHEDSALQTRGLFIRKFPLHSLHELTLDEYVVGHYLDTWDMARRLRFDLVDLVPWACLRMLAALPGCKE